MAEVYNYCPTELLDDFAKHGFVKLIEHGYSDEDIRQLVHMVNRKTRLKH